MLYDKRKAFTMIELIFVIVVLGILAAIAIPRLAVTRDDAQITKGRSDVASIRSAIVTERQSRLLRGQSAYVNQLDDAAYNTAGESLFDDNDSNAANGGTILTYGVQSATGNGHWMKTALNTYTFTVMNQPVIFDYTLSTGRFDCNRSIAGNAGTYCKSLVD